MKQKHLINAIQVKTMLSNYLPVQYCRNYILILKKKKNEKEQ